MPISKCLGWSVESICKCFVILFWSKKVGIQYKKHQNYAIIFLNKCQLSNTITDCIYGTKKTKI